MILTGEECRPSDYESITEPKPPKTESELTVDIAIEFLKSQGYNVSSLLSRD